jgi:membrane dipeptidase
MGLQLTACSKSPEPAAAPQAESVAEKAHRITSSSIIVDTHIDLPMRLAEADSDITVAQNRYDFDYPKAVAGGLNVPFMSIYTAAELEATGGSREKAEQLIDVVESIQDRWPDKFRIARSTADVREQFAAGLISLPMGMENGSPIEGDLDNIQYFYDRGIRYITMAHSLANHLSDSSYDDERKWNGLSPLGKQAVAEMNRLGIMVDVSHLSDDAFWQVMELSAAPVIASHSSARHFTPGAERNMNDEMIKALAENGGVIQINFGSYFVTNEAREYGSARSAAGKVYLAQHPELTESYIYSEYPAIYAAENGPYPYATLDDVLDHFDHVVSLAGIDHVGIGSDYEGVGDSLPVGLKNVSAYPNLIEGLLQRGYSEDEIRKILGENLLRVWQEVEEHAASAAASE